MAEYVIMSYWTSGVVIVAVLGFLPFATMSDDLAQSYASLPVTFELSSLSGGAGGGGSATSRTPFKVKMTGFVYSATKGQQTLGPVTFGIAALKQSYAFALATLEAVDRPRISTRQILRTLRRYENNFDVVGPVQLLSQIAQAEPGTYMALTGFLTLRTRRLQLTSIQAQPQAASDPDSLTRREQRGLLKSMDYSMTPHNFH